VTARGWSSKGTLDVRAAQGTFYIVTGTGEDGRTRARHDDHLTVRARRTDSQALAVALGTSTGDGGQWARSVVAVSIANVTVERGTVSRAGAAPHKLILGDGKEITGVRS
jgi:hypothetical protein